jgi:hypothetical protein
MATREATTECRWWLPMIPPIAMAAADSSLSLAVIAGEIDY